MSARAGLRASLAAAAALALLAPAALVGQPGVRGSFQTTLRYLELRPIRQDTVDIGDVTVGDDSSMTFEGRPVFCGGTPTCVFYRPLDVEGNLTATQDLSLTAWGFGMRGLSATLLLRSRANLGGALDLPFANDPFDAVLAYAELDRGAYRLRAGRQRSLSALGSVGFDGVEALWDARDWLRVEAFAGRSLGRALAEPRSAALRGLDDIDFLDDSPVLLLGGQVGVEGGGHALTLRYQREGYWESGELLSERASLAGRTDALAPVSLAAGADWDFAFGRVGKAHLTARMPVAGRRVLLEATARRYLPYFELWTIWGYFSPVAYHEGELRATWTPSPRATAWGSGAWRTYGETEAPTFAEPLKDQSWRAVLGGRLRLGEAWTLDGEYATEGPVGAFLASGSAALRWRPREAYGLGVHALALQQVDEFRVGEGYVLGGGASGDVELTRAARVLGGIDLYRQVDARQSGDWNQLRSWMVLQVDFGRDPGRAP